MGSVEDQKSPAVRSIWVQLRLFWMSPTEWLQGFASTLLFVFRVQPRTFPSLSILTACSSFSSSLLCALALLCFRCRCCICQCDYWQHYHHNEIPSHDLIFSFSSHLHPSSSLSLLITAVLRFTQSRHTHCFECVLVIGLLSLNLSWSISCRFASSARLLLTVFTVS